MPLQGVKRGKRKSRVPVKRKKLVESSEDTEVGTSSDVQAQSSESITLNPANTYLNVLPLNGSNIVRLVTSSEVASVSSSNRSSVILSTSVINSADSSSPALQAVTEVSSSSNSTPDEVSSLILSSSSEVPSTTDEVNRNPSIASTMITGEPSCSSVSDINPEPSSSNANEILVSCQEVVSQTRNNILFPVINTNLPNVQVPLPLPGSSTDSTAELNDIGEDECPVCLQVCVHPAKLPCNHVFCYLCLKGIARARLPCPLCRGPIPFHFADQPELVTSSGSSSNGNEEPEEKFCWFYQGRHGGWWQFEQRMSDEIEENRESGVPQFELMICGSLYVIDTVSCVQFPKNCPTRVRKLRRELPSRVNKKGVAGIYGCPGKSTGKY